MLQNNQEVEFALSKYPNFELTFKENLTNPTLKLEHLLGVSVLPMFEDTLRIQALGKEIEYKFSLVFTEDGFSPKGQITAYLVNYSGIELDIKHEKEFISFWFDELGNVMFPTHEQNTIYNLTQKHCLGAIVETTLKAIISSEECQPASNG